MEMAKSTMKVCPCSLIMWCNDINWYNILIGVLLLFPAEFVAMMTSK